MYLVGLLLGSLEVLLTVWLVLLVIEGSGWGLMGLIAYYIWSLYIGGTALKLVITTISSVCLAFTFLYFGFWIAVLAFIGFAIIFEFIPRSDDD